MTAIMSLAGGLGMQSAYAAVTDLGATVTISATCEAVLAAATPSLAFGNVDPVVNSADDGGASATGTASQITDGFKITINNDGNQASSIVVDGTNWEDTSFTPVEVMSAGQTKFSDTAGVIADKTALPNNEATAPVEAAVLLTVIEPDAPDNGVEDTFWDLDVTLDILPTFLTGTLSQVITLDFACVAPAVV